MIDYGHCHGCGVVLDQTRFGRRTDCARCKRRRTARFRVGDRVETATWVKPAQFARRLGWAVGINRRDGEIGVSFIPHPRLDGRTEIDAWFVAAELEIKKAPQTLSDGPGAAPDVLRGPSRVGPSQTLLGRMP
jgi:hypothetical protein